ncbi:alcohol acetyltransferase [Dactylonectria estremocensis]|uniref:Alcohol acetyltransferase n=1 Tax=Dactylonectria estremocensis TaxID=1079267 RepID=A0A9P9E680_9HYPO|nr:alcohol acetyltransferase [Dactylonectria estremocensis]
MAETPSPLAIRPLGPVELFSSTRHPLGLYRCVVLSGRYTNPPETTADLFAALGRLVAAHPMLRVGIVGEDTDAAHFSHVAEVDLQKHVGVRTLPAGDGYETGLEAVQAWCHDQLWPDIETRPPWRVIIVRPEMDEGREPFEDIVFAFHHSLMDGTSAKYFHEQLAEALNEPSAETEPPHILQFPDPPVLPEAQEDVIPYTNGKLFMGRVLWGEFAPSFLQPAKPPIWAGSPIDLDRPHRARVRAVDIPPAVVSSMLAQSRSHSASIASLLHALCLVSMARRIPAQDAPAFTASTPVNARPYMAATANPALKDSFRVMISSLTHEYSAAAVDALRRPDADLDALIWHHAQVVKDEIRTRAATLPADDPTSLLKFISDWSSYWHKKNGQPRDGSWEISSLGAMRANTNTNRPNQRRISRVLFTNGIMVAGAPLSVSVASSPDGELTAGISWNAGVVPDELMEGLADDLLAYTTRLHETGKFTA